MCTAVIRPILTNEKRFRHKNSHLRSKEITEDVLHRNNWCNLHLKIMLYTPSLDLFIKNVAVNFARQLKRPTVLRDMINLILLHDCQSQIS